MTVLPCAIYTRKSSEEGLEQGFNSLDAQREACEAFILSQKAQGWKATGVYDDGGYSGGNVERPGLQRLLADIKAKRVRVIVVYKVDRLTRSLADFAKLVELFDAHGVSFVSVTQQFNTTSSMGRLTLNVLLSFAQFEREVTGERIRDKIAASKRKGMWMGGFAPLGYVPHERTLAIDEPQAIRVREIFQRYLDLGSVWTLQAELQKRGWTTPVRQGRRPGGGRPFSRGHLYRILANPIYIGRIAHKGQSHPGLHQPIIDFDVWHRVQAQLARNAQVASERSTAAEPSLLAGLVVDETGRRLQPTHAKKGGKRYRYYIRPVVEGSSEERPLRIPATELEGLVIGEVLRWLRDEQRAIGEGTAGETHALIERAMAMAELLESGSPSKRTRILNELLVRVAVGAETVEIVLRTGAPLTGIETAKGDVYSIVVPVALKRCGQAMRLIVQGSHAPKAREINPHLVALLAKSHRWFETLKSGQSPSIRSIAEAHGVESSDVTQTVYLAFLAPDIVERLVRGDHPEWLRVRRLLAMAPLPMEWTEQRRVLGLDD